MLSTTKHAWQQSSTNRCDDAAVHQANKPTMQPLADYGVAADGFVVAAEPVEGGIIARHDLRPASPVDVDQVVVSQKLMAEQGCLVGRQVEQRRPLPGAQDMASRHAALSQSIRSLFWTTPTPR